MVSMISEFAIFIFERLSYTIENGVKKYDEILWDVIRPFENKIEAQSWLEDNGFEMAGDFYDRDYGNFWAKGGKQEDGGYRPLPT
jgi:hypothetical protein